MAKKKPTDPYSTQAAADAVVRFGPEYSALSALLRDAEENRRNALAQAKSGKALALSEIAQAGPLVQGAYQGAQQAVQPAFVQGGGIESSALGARLGEASALAQTQLEGRRLGAIQGASAEGRQALRDFTTAREKIRSRALDLGREQGAFITSQIGDLKAADAKAIADANQLAQSQTNALIGQGLMLDKDGNIVPIPGGKRDPNSPLNQKPGKPNQGKGWASTTAQAAAGDEINRLLDEAKDLKNDPTVSRSEAYQTLKAGINPSSKPIYEVVGTDPTTGKEIRQPVIWKKGDKFADGSPIPASLVGTPKTREIQGVEKAKSTLLLQAALDMAYDHHLSRRTQRLLHARGIQLGPLGLTTFQQWLQTPEGQSWLQAQRPTRRKPRSPAETVPGVGGALSR